MVELGVGNTLAMIGVLALATAVWFGVRAARYARGYKKEFTEEKSSTQE